MDRPTVEHLYLVFTTVTTLVIVVYLRARSLSIRQIQNTPMFTGRPLGGLPTSTLPRSLPQDLLQEDEPPKTPDVERSRFVLQHRDVNRAGSCRSALRHRRLGSCPSRSPRARSVDEEPASYDVEQRRVGHRLPSTAASPGTHVVYETIAEYPEVRYIYELADMAPDHRGRGGRDHAREATTRLSHPRAFGVSNLYAYNSPMNYSGNAYDYTSGPSRSIRGGHQSYDRIQLRRNSLANIEATDGIGSHRKREEKREESPVSDSSSSTPTPRIFSQQQQQPHDEGTLSQCRGCGSLLSAGTLEALEREHARLRRKFGVGEGQSDDLEARFGGGTSRLGEHRGRTEHEGGRVVECDGSGNCLDGQYRTVPTHESRILGYGRSRLRRRSVADDDAGFHIFSGGKGKEKQVD